MGRCRAGLLAGMIVAALSLLVACAGGGGATRLEPGDIARFRLPLVRTTPVRPDTLGQVALVEKPHQLVLQTDASLRQLFRTWSVTWRSRGVRNEGQQDVARTFATLWSSDLSIAALRAEGIFSLSKDLAQRAVRERRAEVDSTIQIDVYRFVGSPAGGRNSLSLVGANANVVLRDGEGRTYRPLREERELVQETFVEGRRLPYQRNIFVFPRVVEGRDVLATARELDLVVRSQGGQGPGYTFSWRFPPPA